MFGLIDCNNFYASCERVFRPDLNGKPVVVLSNNDGCVIARSNEAKQLGIPMGAPSFEYEELFDRQGVNVFSSNYALYGDMSSRVMEIVKSFSPDLEIYSIDEAFVDFRQTMCKDFEALGREMREAVLRGTGIPVSIGFAPSKALAKLANRIAKKFAGRTGSIYAIDKPEKHRRALEWLKIGDVWGIGAAHEARLKQMGINNAWQFTCLNNQWIKKEMSVVGLRLKYELLGTRPAGLEKEKLKQNIACTRSFEENYTELSDLRERVSTYASVCAEKLRKQNSNCNAIMVFIHTNEHRRDLPQYCRNIVLPLPYPSNSAIELSKFACLGLDKIFKPGFAYKKAGIIAMELSPSGKEQLGFFENKNPRHVPLMKAMDLLNGKMGNQKVRLASQSPGRIWKMRQDKLSPRYTTRIKEIIHIKA